MCGLNPLFHPHGEGGDHRPELPTLALSDRGRSGSAGLFCCQQPAFSASSKYCFVIRETQARASFRGHSARGREQNRLGGSALLVLGCVAGLLGLLEQVRSPGGSGDRNALSPSSGGWEAGRLGGWDPGAGRVGSLRGLSP